MAVALGLVKGSRALPRMANNFDEYDPSSGAESSEQPSSRRSSAHYPRPRHSFAASSSVTNGLLSAPEPRRMSSDHYRAHPLAGSSRSICSTETNSPLPSRSNSPFPQFLSSGPSSVCTSDTESEPYESASPLLSTAAPKPWWRKDRRRWWTLGTPDRRRRRRGFSWWRKLKRGIRGMVQHPLFPGQPTTIVLTLLLLTILAIFITLLLIHILNPDKEPLPWRAYCSTPSTYSSPHISLVSPSSGAEPMAPGASYISPPFPPDNLETLPPAGVLVGVFSLDSAFERRMLVRSTWASHSRSRNGAGEGDGGNGTSRTIVRFILGQPTKHLERRIRLEMETYNDIILLPISENMNSGKTHAFFTWTSSFALVPPYYFETDVPPPSHSYSNLTGAPPALANHDPLLARYDRLSSRPKLWVRPDFIVKTDDDSFVMLAELESRLRVELHTKPENLHDVSHAQPFSSRGDSSNDLSPTSVLSHSSPTGINAFQDISYLSDDPLIYWGYLVKNRFMAGEVYALSWTITEWVARDPVVQAMIKGAEDKQTAKWLGMHPRAQEIRWKSERCWIYDHPRAGTVYSHGFLFPSEATRVKKSMSRYFDGTTQDSAIDNINNFGSPSQWVAPGNPPTPSAWAHSSVSTFGVRYTPPVPDLTALQSVEALVEGSDMSSLREGSPMTPEFAWTHREGHRRRYMDKRVGGTVVVHFIKKHVWFLETALALLEGAERSESELQSRVDELEEIVKPGQPAGPSESQGDEATSTHKSAHTPSSTKMLLAHKRR